jgi:hypothetical protein
MAYVIDTTATTNHKKAIYINHLRVGYSLTIIINLSQNSLNSLIEDTQKFNSNNIIL